MMQNVQTNDVFVMGYDDGTVTVHFGKRKLDLDKRQAYDLYKMLGSALRDNIRLD